MGEENGRGIDLRNNENQIRANLREMTVPNQSA